MFGRRKGTKKSKERTKVEGLFAQVDELLSEANIHAWELRWWKRGVFVHYKEKRIQFIGWETRHWPLLAEMVRWAWHDDDCPERGDPPATCRWQGGGRFSRVTAVDPGWDVLIGNRKLVQQDGLTLWEDVDG